MEAKTIIEAEFELDTITHICPYCKLKAKNLPGGNWYAYAKRHDLRCQEHPMRELDKLNEGLRTKLLEIQGRPEHIEKTMGECEDLVKDFVNKACSFEFMTPPDAPPPDSESPMPEVNNG